MRRSAARILSSLLEKSGDGLAPVDDFDRASDRGHHLLGGVDFQGVTDGSEQIRNADRVLFERTCLVESGERPMTWPPLTPPPAMATLNTLGKWSRPAFGLILGVRPNSPIQIHEGVSRACPPA